MALWVAMLAGCTSTPKHDSPSISESPQASAEPAPIAPAPSLSEPGTRPDAGPPREILRGDRRAPPDVSTPRETHDGAAREQKPSGGYGLEAIFRWSDLPPASHGAEVGTAAIDALRKRSEPHLAVEILPGRVRAVVGSGFLLPEGTELRARNDQVGELAFLPGEEGYHVVAPGALRAFLGERRLDVAPFAGMETRALEPGHRLGVPTRRIEVTTRAGRAVLELGTLRDVTDGGPLLCRVLIDLLNAPPSAIPCEPDEVPLHAEFHWTNHGGLTFEVTSIERRADLAGTNLLVPSAMTPWMAEAPGVPDSEMMLSKADLALFRTGPVEVPVVTGDARRPLPEGGLVLVNTSDELRVVWLDGVPLAWVAPGRDVAVPSLVRGRYQIQWRSFLGDITDAVRTQTVPGLSEPQN